MSKLGPPLQASTVRPARSNDSLASSSSNVTTTPPSPRFPHHSSHSPHPYASASTVSSTSSRQPYHSSSSASISTMASSISTQSVVHPPRAATPPLYRPPANTSFTAYIRSWGDEEVTQFLEIYRCGHHALSFHRNDITGQVILDLDMATLKELGVEKVGERVKLMNGIKDLRRRRANCRPVPPPVAVRVTPEPETGHSRSNSGRRLEIGRPPPLELHQTTSRNLPQIYQPGSTQPLSHSRSESRSTTPKPTAPIKIQPAPSTAATSSSSSSASTATAGLVPGPTPSTRNASLRAPPTREGRRSPSPVNGDPSNFADRPLPPAPSSAASYASSIQTQRQQSTDSNKSDAPWSNNGQYGLPRGPAPDERRAMASSRPGAAQTRPPNPPVRFQSSPVVPSAQSHHKSSSLSGKSTSPIKNKFSAMLGKSTSSAGSSVHPYAAVRREEESPTSLLPPQSLAVGEVTPVRETFTTTPTAASSNHRRQQPSSSTTANRSRNASLPHEHDSPSISEGREKPDQPLSIDEIRRICVKFINAEDETSRIINVSSCEGGIEVLEKVLRKFNKWGTGTHVARVDSGSESGDDAGLAVDGWGVYLEQTPGDSGMYCC